VVPPAPGLFSAFGLLYAEPERHYVRSARGATSRLDVALLAEAWERLEAEARADFGRDGLAGATVRLRRLADARYLGQTSELTVVAPDGPVGPAWLTALEEAFGREYERTYGHRAGPEEPVELVNLRLVARGVADRPRVPDRVDVGRDGGATRPAPRQAYFGPESGWLATPVLRRADLATRTAGPCIVEEYDATCLVPPGAHAELDAAGNIVIAL
jgi:N-methylhydantoinase A